MKEVIKVLELNNCDYGIIINALNELRNKLIRENQETDIIDDLLLRVLDAPQKKREFVKDSSIECR